ncbi:MAG TPA: TonB-dependent receptor [Thermoanaerobaculia bacterium]|jgi:outer membrane receptor protein involved in Fe transport
MKSAYRFSLALAVCLLFLLPVPAVSQTTGRIEGMVVDQNGAPLPGVTVEVTSPNLQGSRTAVTGNDGRYHLASLTPGTYKVTASLAGLGTVEKTTTVALDATATANVQLSLTAKEVVTVTGEAPLVDTTSTTGGTNYTSQVIGKLPLGRNYAEIIRSNPGVNTDQGDTQGRAVALTVYGATSVENQFIIDGVNTTNVIRGFQGKAINGEFIQEVEIKTGGYQAEYGRALGGVINVITKSGGNEFHGDGFVYYDSFGMRADQVINEQDYFQGMRVNGYNRTDFGVDIGGRIIRDKLWFFGAYDRVSKPTDISRYNDSPNGQVTRDLKFPADSTDNLYSGKLTWNVATGTTLVGTIFADPTKVEGAAASDPTHSYYPVPIVNTDPSTWQSTLEIGGADYGLRVNQLFGSRGLLTIQGSHHKDRYHTIPSGAGAGIRQEDWTCAGGTPDNPCTQPNEPNTATGGFGYVTGFIRNNDSTRNQVRGDLSLYLGNHEMKVGGDYQVGKTNAITTISGLQQVSKFNEYGQTYYAHSFWAAGPGDLTPVNNTVSPKTYNESAFFQDSWKVLPGLTLNAGVRWDREDLRSYTGESVITLTNEWQPRIGIVWDPRRDGSMKVYAFAGRFYYALPTDLNVRSYGQQLFATTYNFDPTSVVQDPSVIGHGTAHTQGGIFAEPHDEGLKGIYQDELTVGIEKLIDPTFSVGIKGEYRRFGRAVEDRCDADYDIDRAPENAGNTCVITNPGGSGTYATGNFHGCNGLDGDAYECGIFPINTLLGGPLPDAKRLYRGIELLARKTFTDKLWVQASYVYSSLRGNYDGEVKQDYQQTDPGITADFDYASFLKNKYGRLYLDRPHNFRLDASYVTPFRLSVGLQTFVQSGPPLSVVGYFNQFYIAQTQLVRLGSAGRLKTQWEANLSLGYPVQLGPVTVTGLFYVFNIFNNQIITNVDNNWQISQGANYPKSPDQYNQLFFAPCTAAQASDPVGNRCNEQKNDNYGKATSRQDPRLFRAAIKVTF